MPNNLPPGLPDLSTIPPDTLKQLTDLYSKTYSGGLPPSTGAAPFWAPPGTNVYGGDMPAAANPAGTGTPSPAVQPLNPGLYPTPAIPDNWQTLPPEQQQALYDRYQMSTTWKELPTEWRAEISGWPQSYRDAFLQTYQLHATGVLYDGQFMSGDEAAAKIRDAARQYLQSQANSNANASNNANRIKANAGARLPNETGLPFIQPSPYLS